MALSMNDKYGSALWQTASRLHNVSETLFQLLKRLDHDTPHQLRDTLEIMAPATRKASHELEEILRILNYETKD